MTIWQLKMHVCGDPDEATYLFSSIENAVEFCKRENVSEGWEIINEDEDEGEKFIDFKLKDPQFPNNSALNQYLYCEIVPFELDPIHL